MPYTYKKEGDKYVVYLKKTGKRVGATKGNKAALKKYLAALHVHTKNESYMKNSKPIKLKSLLNLRESEERDDKTMDKDQKKAFLEAVYQFADHSKSIYRQHNIKEVSQYLGELLEAAEHLTLSETQDWFDNVTVSRHMKHLGEAYKIFEKTATEMDTLQQRLEACYEDIGETLGKYYDINGMVNEVNEATEANPEQEKEYRKFFTKSLKKFKVKGPEDLETDKQRKKFFNYIDKNYQAPSEPKEDSNEE